MHPSLEQKWLKLICNVNIVYANLKSDNSQDYPQNLHPRRGTVRLEKKKITYYKGTDVHSCIHRFINKEFVLILGALTPATNILLAHLANLWPFSTKSLFPSTRRQSSCFREVVSTTLHVFCTYVTASTENQQIPREGNATSCLLSPP